MLYGVGGRKRGPKLQRRSLPAPRRPPGKKGPPKRRPRSRARLLYRLWRNRPVKGKRWGRYLPFLPIILNWIQQTLDAHAHERRAGSAFNFSRLPPYFSEGLFLSASVV